MSYFRVRVLWTSKKYIHNLKVENYVLISGNILRLQAQEIASQVNLRETTLRWREEPSFTEVLQQSVSSLNIKRLLLIKEEQIFQIKEFNAFFMYEKMPKSGLNEIIPLICTSAI